MLHVLIDPRFSWVLQKIGQALVDEYQKIGQKAQLITEVTEVPDGSELIVMNYNLYRTSFHKQFSRVGVFLTHAETEVKRLEFRQILNNADYVICMSSSDAYDALALDISKPLPTNIFYKNLPAIENKKILPFVVSVFSNCYSDGRKREHMLLDWIDCHNPGNIIIRLIGSGWLDFCHQLELRNVAFQMSSLGSNIDHEYVLQQSFFYGSDVCLYTGNDGGALCVYDALELKVRPLMYRMGYSGELLDPRDTFSDEDFNSKITAAYDNYVDYASRLSINEISLYVASLKEFIDSRSSIMRVDTGLHYRPLNILSFQNLRLKNIRSILRFLRSKIG